jgi:hypothetical protein
LLRVKSSRFSLGDNNRITCVERNLLNAPVGDGIDERAVGRTGVNDNGATVAKTYFDFDWSRDGRQIVCTRGIYNSEVVLIKNFTERLGATASQ